MHLTILKTINGIQLLYIYLIDFFLCPYPDSKEFFDSSFLFVLADLEKELLAN